MKANALHGGGRRLSVRAVKGAGVWRSMERSGNPCTEEAGGSGAGFSQEGQEGLRQIRLRNGGKEQALCVAECVK